MTVSAVASVTLLVLHLHQFFSTIINTENHGGKAVLFSPFVSDNIFSAPQISLS